MPVQLVPAQTRSVWVNLSGLAPCSTLGVQAFIYGTALCSALGCRVNKPTSASMMMRELSREPFKVFWMRMAAELRDRALLRAAGRGMPKCPHGRASVSGRSILCVGGWRPLGSSMEIASSISAATAAPRYGAHGAEGSPDSKTNTCFP
jgi:hypothetical protein